MIFSSVRVQLFVINIDTQPILYSSWYQVTFGSFLYCHTHFLGHDLNRTYPSTVKNGVDYVSIQQLDYLLFYHLHHIRV